MGRALLREVLGLVLPRHTRHITVALSPAEAFLCTKKQEHHGSTASSNMLWFCWGNRSKQEFGAPIILSHFSTWCSGQNVLVYRCCILNYVNSPDCINRIIYPFRSRYRFSVFTEMKYWFPLFMVQLFSLLFFSLTYFDSNKLHLCKKANYTNKNSVYQNVQLSHSRFILTHMNSPIWLIWSIFSASL